MTQQIAIGTAIVDGAGRSAIVVEQMPHTVAVRVKYDDAKFQRRAKGKADILYPSDFVVVEVR